MMFNAQETGKRMKKIRVSMGYTQDQFAELLHISRDHLAKLEIGKRTPSLEILFIMVTITNTSFDYIIMGKENCYIKL